MPCKWRHTVHSLLVRTFFLWLNAFVLFLWCMCQKIVPFYCLIVFHSVSGPHSVYLAMGQKLFPIFGKSLWTFVFRFLWFWYVNCLLLNLSNIFEALFSMKCFYFKMENYWIEGRKLGILNLSSLCHWLPNDSGFLMILDKWPFIVKSLVKTSGFSRWESQSK